MFNDKYGLTKAVLEGRKTQTRREIKTSRTFRGQDVNGFWLYRRPGSSEVVEVCMKDYDDAEIDGGQIRPKYDFDEIVAVLQSYKYAGVTPDYIVSYKKDGTPITAIQSPGWTNKMFTRTDLMPHHIRITAVRVERLQDISDEDCMKEGIIYEKELATSRPYGCLNEYGAFMALGSTPREAFAALIDKVSGKGTWDKNPYVFVYEFTLVQ